MSNTCLAFNPDLGGLKGQFPAGSCDTHFHVFESSGPSVLSNDRSYTPQEAPFAAYRRMMRASGLERAVLVQPSVYGTDHALFSQLLADSQDWLRGVAVVRADTALSEVEQLHRLGARGSRFNDLFGAGAPTSELDGIVGRIKPFGWHLQVCVDVDAQPQRLTSLIKYDVPLVIDHMGHFLATRVTASRGFANMLDLLRDGLVWVKLSGAYRLTAMRFGFEEVLPIVERLLETRPDRLVWGSDWPHPAIAAPMVRDPELINLALSWMSDPVLRQQIMVSNPTSLYWI